MAWMVAILPWCQEARRTLRVSAKIGGGKLPRSTFILRTQELRIDGTYWKEINSGRPNEKEINKIPTVKLVQMV